MDPGQDHLLLRVPMRLALKWLSTEGMDKKLFSEKSDVWSFGITMWELFSYGRAPYGKVKTTMIQKAVREGLRLSCPAGCPQEVWALLCSCWLVDPTDRPTFAELQYVAIGFACPLRLICSDQSQATCSAHFGYSFPWPCLLRAAFR